MATSEVKVLGSWSSPFVMRTRIALYIKSINYEYIEEKLSGGRNELLRISNPVYKKIPVLIHGDKPISESLIIVQHIDETWPSAPFTLPSDPYERAVARFWAAYPDNKVFMFHGVVIEKINGTKLMNEAKVLVMVNWVERFCSYVVAEDFMPNIDKLTKFDPRNSTIDRRWRFDSPDGTTPLNKKQANVVVSEDDLSFIIDGAPFEFKYNHTGILEKVLIEGIREMRTL
ncbi:Glutathione S-transferase U17 [Hibiscus syriacus]|uniref:Glutathione S-transferase n=1 Tax=Hibiscus syriacus TaxID=106335 RepID=A0A6A2ZX52_HIBSY|nr:Glutathione S-transferase U17 [Hibiscus syriacus]